MIRDSIKKVLDQFVSGQPSLSQQVIQPRISDLVYLISAEIESGDNFITRDQLRNALQAHDLWDSYQLDASSRSLEGILKNVSSDLKSFGKDANKFRNAKAVGEGQLMAVDDRDLFEELCRRYPNFIAAFQTQVDKTPQLFRSNTDKVILAGLAAMLLSVISDPKAG